MTAPLARVRFGKLTLLSLASGRGHGTLAVCRCDCGNRKTVPLRHLYAESYLSCGQKCPHRPIKREAKPQIGAGRG